MWFVSKFTLSILTPIFLQALEDLYLQETEQQASATNEFVAAMYIASSLFAPSYQNYYRRILTLSPFDTVMESVDPICQRIVSHFEVFWKLSCTPHFI
jgi:hypothetical protein